MSSLRDRKSSRIEEADSAAGLLALSAPCLPEVVIGTIVRLADSGAPEVDFPANPSGAPVAALTTALIDASQVGRQAALVFVEGDPSRPLIVGLIHHPEAETAKPRSGRRRARGRSAPRWRAGRAHRRARDRAPLRQVEPRPHPRRQGADPRRLPAQPLLRRQPHQGRLGADQLAAAADGPAQRHEDGRGIHARRRAVRARAPRRRRQGHLRLPQGRRRGEAGGSAGAVRLRRHLHRRSRAFPHRWTSRISPSASRAATCC